MRMQIGWFAHGWRVDEDADWGVLNMGGVDEDADWMFEHGWWVV